VNGLSLCEKTAQTEVDECQHIVDTLKAHTSWTREVSRATLPMEVAKHGWSRGGEIVGGRAASEG
jgi:hypothetical protein